MREIRDDKRKSIPAKGEGQVRMTKGRDLTPPGVVIETLSIIHGEKLLTVILRSFSDEGSRMRFFASLRMTG